MIKLKLNVSAGGMKIYEINDVIDFVLKPSKDDKRIMIVNSLGDIRTLHITNESQIEMQIIKEELTP